MSVAPKASTDRHPKALERCLQQRRSSRGCLSPTGHSRTPANPRGIPPGNKKTTLFRLSCRFFLKTEFPAGRRERITFPSNLTLGSRL